jgi:hypothetical protein
VRGNGWVGESESWWGDKWKQGAGVYKPNQVRKKKLFSRRGYCSHD